MATRPIRSSHSRQFSTARTGSGSRQTAEGRKYPEIKQRGYYSDILVEGADQELGVRNIIISI
jgi:hypothetical protein